MAAPSLDKYRDYLSEEELRCTHWRFGPPDFDDVNRLYEEGRTKIWPAGSLEDKVQRLLMTFEMELIHKANPDEIKSFDAKKFTLSVRARKPLTLEEIAKLGGYNVFLQTELPKKFRIFDPANGSAESIFNTFNTAFPRGFTPEVIKVYSGPPVIVYKYRHWAYMEGPFGEFPATGELVQFFAIGILELDEHKKIVKMETFMDLGQFYEGMVKGMDSD